MQRCFQRAGVKCVSQGTLHFMAVETFVNESNLTHEARHDLESFFWLLVWLVLRHTKHEPIAMCEDSAWHKLFDGAKMVDCLEGKKYFWLTIVFPPVMVTDNEPLNALLENFRLLCRTNSFNVGLKQPWMTHKDVLRLPNEALAARSKWPQADRAIVHTMDHACDAAQGHHGRSGPWPASHERHSDAHLIHTVCFRGSTRPPFRRGCGAISHHPARRR